METYNCLHCGKENKKKSSTTNKYCDNYCQHEYQYNQRLAEWRETGTTAKGTIKRYLAEQKEGCWSCGVSDWMGQPLVLELEHIDGNSDNNQEENLSLMCPNCHSLTPTYKNRNMGKGRHYRRQRYAEGKSF